MGYRIVTIIVWTILATAVQPAILMAANATTEPFNPTRAQPDQAVHIERMEPPEKGGQGYRLVYWVNVPTKVYWRFKTDFDNQFLVENKFISEHRFISRKDDTVITENKYTYGPDVYFRWQTKVISDLRRLDFILLNPKQCRQAYHYGTIRIAADTGGTRVTQEAYFDFWGASFWAFYPWKGGMRDFLTYTAQWEQKTALRLKDRYLDITDP